MRMQEEEVLDAGKSDENGEPADQSVQEAPAYTPDLTISQKYRELKSKLKYLVYVRVALSEYQLFYSLILSLGAQIF